MIELTMAPQMILTDASVVILRAHLSIMLEFWKHAVLFHLML